MITTVHIKVLFSFLHTENCRKTSPSVQPTVGEIFRQKTPRSECTDSSWSVFCRADTSWASKALFYGEVSLSIHRRTSALQTFNEMYLVRTLLLMTRICYSHSMEISSEVLGNLDNGRANTTTHYYYCYAHVPHKVTYILSKKKWPEIYLHKLSDSKCLEIHLNSY